MYSQASCPAQGHPIATGVSRLSRLVANTGLPAFAGNNDRAVSRTLCKRTNPMKITDVTLTLFSWDDIPATRYAAHTGRFGGASQLGLLTIRTDEGIDGHAFLGSAYHSAAHDGPGLVQYLKPIVMGQDPLERERLYQAMWRRNRTAS